MQFSTVIAAIAIMASTATAQGVDLENIAAFEFYTSSDCTGTPANVITSAPSDCLNVSNKFSYEAFCT
ncbi:predicted protein [Pyrenophora tritici-repentis Pt-1C-BFP]|uniref:Uncharacterized protein n=1 Tax=Pyrenophora tritici-repentis (strain Pt-1C-BFP) TaxID=426418 RepID=B2W7M2_PYRTR|nr:uncharacterized protein PTRG_05810 [Pyrenophora tritici-repentis Pt-1C-BFP]EDU48730.1 predicted protein [Pyrenophora tritici-repentis Pt-1C-BFP]